MRTCWLCGRNGADDPLDEHHVFEGTGKRPVSVKYNITVDLCHNRCHIFGPKAAHNSRETADLLHRYGQKRMMLENRLTVEEFRRLVGKNYLDEDEIQAVYAEMFGLLPAADAGEYYQTEEEWPVWSA